MARQLILVFQLSAFGGKILKIKEALKEFPEVGK
jgi:hypothetical protein